MDRRPGTAPLNRVSLLATLVGACAIGGCSLALASDIDDTSNGGEDAGGPNASPEAGSSDTATPPGEWALGAPFATDAPPFAPAEHPLTPSTRWGSLKAPYPTNAAWNDLVLGTGQQKFPVFPYLVKALDTGLEISSPKHVVSADNVMAIFNRDLAFGASETLGARNVTAYDALSVTVRWDAPGGASLTTPLVRGMAYATALYDKLIPKLGTVHALLTINGAPPASVTGDRFVLTLNNGSTWVVYASTPITFAPGGGGLLASAPFSGTIRVAVVNDPSDLAVLDAHRGAIPIGGEVAASIRGDDATVTLRWKKQGTGPLAMVALPHHLAGLSGATPLPAKHRTLRGAATVVEGDSFRLALPLVPYSWSAPRAPKPERVAAIKEALAADANVLPVADDPYFFGKQAARLGRLALIADELGEATIASATRTKLATVLTPWLEGKNDDALLYDTVYRGIVSTKGLADPGADFGNGLYNDHHFHYGYFLYAAAALGKGDSAWLGRHKAAIVAIARDIANPSTADTSFTPFRHYDWYEGHSWAAGLTEFGDGRNQESTSEAVNAWYGLELLGRALGDANMTNVGRILLASEIRGAQTYWQITSGTPIYDEPYAARKVVGVLWGSKVEHATFFGLDLELIHGIQMLPFTPVSEALLAKSWVAESWPLLAPAAASAEPGWRGILAMDHAIIDANAAWAELSALSSWDDGNSRANALYWVATRP